MTLSWDIRCCKAQELLAGLEDDSVDLLFTDPPYNLGQYSRGNITFKERSDINNDLAAWDQEAFSPHDWLDEFRRVLKPTGNLFAFTAYNMFGKWHEAFDPVFDTFQLMVWHKTNPTPKIRKSGFLNSCELLVCAWNKGHTWNFKGQREMHNFVESPVCMGRERWKAPKHPTQKPLKILRHIVEIASNPGDLIVDPFMGVGSMGVAAKELGRSFLGSDVAPEYVEAARMRLDQAVSGEAQGLPSEREVP